MSDPTMIRDVFGNYLRMREQIDKEAELPMQKKIREAMQGCQEEEAIKEWLKPLPDRVTNTDDPRTERAILAETVGTNPYVETAAPITTPNTGTTYDRKLEESQGKFYSTDGHWSDNEEDLETPNERTARLAAGIPALGQPPGYGNKFEYPTHAAVMRATANTPPPLDDVGGCDPNDFFPEERFDPNAPDLDDYLTCTTPPQDLVNSPAHYKGNGFEAIDVIEAFSLPYTLGNVVKYVLRAGRKGERRQDLEKALWYLKRELSTSSVSSSS